jgi:hypothetical protein
VAETANMAEMVATAGMVAAPTTAMAVMAAGEEMAVE